MAATFSIYEDADGGKSRQTGLKISILIHLRALNQGMQGFVAATYDYIGNFCNILNFSAM